MSDDVNEKSRHRPRRVSKPKTGTRLSAVEIHDNLLASATADAARPSASLFWSSLAAGLVIGFSFLAAAFLSTLADAPAAKAALVALGYPLGFVFVVIGRMELFTENTLEPILPLLHERSKKNVREVLRLWAVLLVGNMLGAGIFAALVACTPVAPERLHDALHNVAVAGTDGSALQVFYRGVYAGWLIALMSWLLGSTSARGAQVIIVLACAAAISAFEFRHSIAGAVEAFYLVGTGEASLVHTIGRFILPSILGNAVGGVVLVALLNYGQVKREVARGAKTK